MKSVSLFLASTKNGALWFLLGIGMPLALWGFRMPGGDIPYLLAGAILIIIAAFFVIVRIITRLILRLRKQPEVVPPFAGWRTWGLCSGVVLVLGLVGALGVPFRLAFAASRPQLERFVKSYDNEPLPIGEFQIGLFPISTVDPIEGGIQFTFHKSEFLWGKRGIYYSVSGERIERSYFYDQEKIGSNWFSWHYGRW